MRLPPLCRDFPGTSQLHLFGCAVTGAAVSPHSPTQPPTTQRDSLWGHPMSSQLCECGFRAGADVWSPLCEWAKSGDSAWGSNAGQTWRSKELRPHDTSRSGVCHIMVDFWIPPRTREGPAGLRLWVSCYMVFGLVHMSWVMLCQITPGSNADYKTLYVFVQNISVGFMTFFCLHGLHLWVWLCFFH